MDRVESYGWTSAESPASFGYLVPGVLAALGALAPRRVLDLGCGNGALCAELRRRGYDVAGVENDAEGLELARRAAAGIPFYRFGVQDDPAQLARREPPFDAVVSTEVVEHLYAPHLLPRFAHAVLRPGGHLVITTPYHGYLKNLVLSLSNKWDSHHTALWHGGHIKFWSRRSLSQLLQENGFRVIAFAGLGRMPYLWKSMLLVAQRS